jgi:hypothetical protein
VLNKSTVPISSTRLQKGTVAYRRVRDVESRVPAGGISGARPSHPERIVIGPDDKSTAIRTNQLISGSVRANTFRSVTHMTIARTYDGNAQGEGAPWWWRSRS